MDELTKAFRQLKKRDVDTFPAVVNSVDKVKGTCTVKADELEFTNVQLSAIIDGSNKKFFLFPALESSVLVSPINEDLHHLYVEAYSEIESMDFTVDAVQLQVDKDGFLMRKDTETLKILMTDLIAAIKALKFTTNTGSTIKLINIAEFEAVEERFNQFLK